MGTSGESVTTEQGQAHGATREEAPGASQRLPGKEPTHGRGWQGTLVQHSLGDKEVLFLGQNSLQL